MFSEKGNGVFHVLGTILPPGGFIIGILLVTASLFVVAVGFYRLLTPIEVMVHSDGQVHVFETDRPPALSNGFVHIRTQNGMVVLQAERLEWSRK